MNLWLLPLLLFLSSCSGLLYYPTHNLHFDPNRLNLKPEEIHFSSLEGKKLFGWFFKHKKPSPAKATLVYFHGNSENLSSHYLNIVWILDHEIDLFVFDYQGYGRSEGEPSPKGTVQDGRAALTWASQKNPNLPLVVFGQSLGGAIALASVLEEKNLPIKFVAVDSTFASYRSVGRSVMSKHFLTWPFQWLGWLLMSDAYAPKGRLKEISPTPLLVIHGEKDKLVDIELGRSVFEEAKEPKEFWSLPAGGHTDVFATQDPALKQKFISLIMSAVEKK